MGAEQADVIFKRKQLYVRFKDTSVSHEECADFKIVQCIVHQRLFSTYLAEYAVESF